MINTTHLVISVHAHIVREVFGGVKAQQGVSAVASEDHFDIIDVLVVAQDQLELGVQTRPGQVLPLVQALAGAEGGQLGGESGREPRRSIEVAEEGHAYGVVTGVEELAGCRPEASLHVLVLILLVDFVDTTDDLD